MTTRRNTFGELVHQLTTNVSRTDLPSGSGITQIRRFLANILIEDSGVSMLRVGPDYFVYPSWFTDLEHYFPLDETSRARDAYGNLLGGVEVGSPIYDTFYDPLHGADGFLRRFASLSNGNHFNLGDITYLDAKDEFIIGMRIRLTDSVFPKVILSRWPSDDAEKQFRITIQEGGFLRIDVASDAIGGVAQYNVTDNNFILSQDIWDDLFITFDLTAVRLVKLLASGDFGTHTLTRTGGTAFTLETVGSDVFIGHDESGEYADAEEIDIYDIIIFDGLSTTEPDAFLRDTDDDRGIVGLCKLPGTLDTNLMPINNKAISQPLARKRRNI